MQDWISAVSNFSDASFNTDPDGGRVGMIDAVILRVLPQIYLERLSDGTTVFRDELGEVRAAEEELQRQAQQVQEWPSMAPTSLK